MRPFTVLIAAITSAAFIHITFDRALEQVESEPVSAPVGIAAVVERIVNRMSAFEKHAPAFPKIAFLGDSTAVSYDSRDWVTTVLRHGLQRRIPKARAKVFAFTFSGMHPSEYYYLSSSISEGSPDAAVIVFNLASFDRSWIGGTSHGQLAGWVAPGMIPEMLFMPLHWMGISLDELLLYVITVQLGLGDFWIGAAEKQEKLRELYDDWTESFGKPPEVILGVQVRKVWNLSSKPHRPTPYYVRQRWGDALDGVDPDHPILSIYGSTVEKYRALDIPVWVYITPINLEYFDTLQMLDREGLDHTIASIRQVVEANGAQLIDLHDLLPDAGFRDATGHYTVDSPVDGTLILGEALADAISETIGTMAAEAD